MVVCSMVFGAAAGAFVPRVAHRLAVPFGTQPRSACGKCARPFRGWVRAGGACPCAAAPWPAIAGTAGAAGLLGATVDDESLLPALLLAVLLGALLCQIDVRCLRLPDPVVGALAVVIAVPLTVRAVAVGEWSRLGSAGLATGLVGCAYLILAVLARGGLGLGDVKLAAVLGFALGYLGWSAVAVGLLAPSLINGPLVLFLLVTGRARRGTALPFGPALLIGALLAVTTA
jgi:leader peptidase (prepilin peptidase) / N-methyltransferase